MKKNIKWIVLLIASIGLFSPNYTQYQLSPLAPQLMEQFRLSATQFASVFSAPMIPAIFIGLISGLLVDKYGMKVVIGIALVIAAAGSCLRIFVGGYTGLYLTMIMVGMGATFLNPNSAKIVGSFFPPEKVSGRVSILLAAATVAMTVGLATTAFFSSIRTAFTVSAAIAVLAALLWSVFMKEPSRVTASNEKAETISMKHALAVVVKSKAVWVIGFCLFGILACNVAMSSFLPTALIQRGIDQVSAGIYASITTVGYLLGCLMIPFVVNKIGRMKPVLFVLAVLSVIGVAFSWKLPEGFLLGSGLFLTGAVISGMMPLLFSIPIQLEEIGPRYAGTAGGFTSTLELLGAVLVPAYIITPIAGGNMSLYFVVAGGCMAAVAVLVFFLPEVMKNKKIDTQ